MTREQAKEEAKKRLQDYISLKGINPSGPFRCLNPQHHDNNPSMSIDKKNLQAHCFSCGAKYDVFDLIQIDTGLKGNDLFLKGFEMFGIRVDAEKPNSQRVPEAVKEQRTDPEPEKVDDRETDYTEYFKEAEKHIAETDYHRGFTLEELKRFHIGYDPAWVNPKRAWIKGEPKTPRLIIPTGKGSYIARATRAFTDDEQKKQPNLRPKEKAGKVNIFNIEAIETATQPIFIVEGELDAISILVCGGQAIGLGSTSMINHFVRFTENHKPKMPFIIGLDADKAGKEAVEKLKAGLEKNGILYSTMEQGWYYKKDANELFQDVRQYLSEAVELEEDKAKEVLNEQKKILIEERTKDSAYNAIAGFEAEIEKTREQKPVLTGFPNLDEALDGGLYPGLFFIGAVSSLGKTTFLLQIADQIAMQGKDVLIFSLEMSQNELIAKSISRLSLSESKRLYGTSRHAKTTVGVLIGRKHNEYSPEDEIIYRSSLQAYKGYSRHLFISEGVGNIGVEQIRSKVQEYKEATGESPVIICDYLQILASTDVRLTDKQAVDKNVIELRRICRDFKTPVLAISSFNRQNYDEPVNMASFKESGSIEFSSDVLIGLQYDGMDETKGDKAKIRELVDKAIKEGKSGGYITLQVKILKNRNGSKGESKINFYPMFNTFTEEGIISRGEKKQKFEIMESTYGKRTTKERKPQENDADRFFDTNRSNI